MISMIPAETYACGRSRLSSSQDTDNYKKLQDDAAAATMTTIIVIMAWVNAPNLFQRAH